MTVSYEHYRTFYYVGKYGNLTLAAKFLFSSQPNVSRTITMLEREYGCRLIERSNRGVKLTPEGEKLYSFVRPAVEQLMLAEDSLSALTDLRHGSVSLGVSDTGLSQVVIPALTVFKERYSNIRVKIATSYCMESVKAVKNSVCDFAVVATPIPEDESLICTQISELSDIMVCGGAYSFLAEKKRSLAELNEYPIICVGGNTVYYPFLTAVYAGEALVFQPDIVSTNTAQTLLMVRNNLGIGFVPEVCAQEELERGDLFKIELERSIPKRSICLVERKNSSLSVAAGELKKLILSMNGI